MEYLLTDVARGARRNCGREQDYLPRLTQYLPDTWSRFFGSIEDDIYHLCSGTSLRMHKDRFYGVFKLTGNLSTCHLEEYEVLHIE